MKEFEQVDQYIIDESPEINYGENPGWTQRIWKTFPALRHRNFQLYFAGQLVSLVGTWLQTVALSLLVWNMTHSAFLVGWVNALTLLPILFFSLFAGVLIDRYSRKVILYWTQISQLILAVTLGVMTLTNSITIPQISILSFLFGIVTAIDMPTRQAFTVEMVGKEDLASAIALNSGTFNVARVIGPAIAGAVIVAIGIGGAFILNGLTFLAVVIALYFIKIVTVIPATHPHPIKAIREGLHFSFSHKIIKPLLIFAAFNAIFGWSYSNIMPAIAAHFFNFGTVGLTLLYISVGAGSLVATFLVSAYSNRINPSIFIFWGNFLFCISLLLFSFMQNVPAALLLLATGGFGLISSFAMMNTTIQHLVTDEIRGRVMSIYTLMFVGMSPIGAFEIGYIADRFGTRFAVGLNATIALIFGIVLYITNKRMRKISYA